MLILKAELSRQLGLSRTYITLLAQGKRKPSRDMVDRLAALGLTSDLIANKCIPEHTTFNSVLMMYRHFKSIILDYSQCLLRYTLRQLV